MIAKGVMLGPDQPVIRHMLDIPPATEALNGVLVVANPANTTALILKEFAPSIPTKNITCLTRLDHNRAHGQISEKLGIQVSDVKNAVIYGNHFCNLLLRFSKFSIHCHSLSALSAASAGCDHIRDWVLGTHEGTWLSIGVYSDGSYNVPVGLIYSFLVTCKNGEWAIVQGLSIDEFSRKKIDAIAWLSVNNAILQS
ncbi:unnamed protein product [Coffea canephora]|uniref:Lactate/malate dehydrogenase C-terminal domain-containing protein n=1 Tax=Coffea canephora TaxID=49390 RepID=A0A068UPH9_COFCA|nr:unnamed protein product [Coffea canephora]